MTKRNNRRCKPVYLCIVEGKRNQTENHFLENLNKEMKDFSIHVYKSDHTDVEGMYLNAVAQINENGLKRDDHVYILLDDDHSKSRKEDIKVFASKSKMITFVVSTPTFENWILSYFAVPSLTLSPGEVIKELKKYLPCYEKGRGFYHQLNGNHFKAIANYRKAQNNLDLPSLSIAMFVEGLLKKRH